jgi:hypothetical protein
MTKTEAPWMRLLALAIVLYVPHLTEEAMTGMHDDPIVAAALAPLTALSPRHAAYLVFQTMMVVTLATALAFGKGGHWRVLVMFVIGTSLLAEAHHLIRAAFTLHYNPGLLTAFPMPVLGAYIVHRIARSRSAGQARLHAATGAPLWDQLP